MARRKSSVLAYWEGVEMISNLRENRLHKIKLWHLEPAEQVKQIVTQSP